VAQTTAIHFEISQLCAKLFEILIDLNHLPATDQELQSKPQRYTNREH
jgi:hypothetical protein